MSQRLTLAELRQTVLDELDHEWRTTTEISRTLVLGHGIDHYRLALVLERLVVDGEAEIKTPGSTVRRFRRSRD
jgi:hypothetical protein